MTALGRLFSRNRTPSHGEDVESFFPSGIHTHLIFSRDDPGLTYIERSIGDRLRVLEKSSYFSLDIVEDADHTFMPARLQNRLTALLTDVLVSRFSGREPSRTVHWHQTVTRS
jgi:hypothetical protein